MPADHKSRRELGVFLRNRRERISPDEVGFPIGPRRRTQGLRREEVAVLAGLSPTWYTYLEQGRNIQPSPEVLDSLARVLRLTEDERRYIHTLAYGQVIHPHPLDADIPAEELLRQLAASLDDNPNPMYSTDIYGNLVAWNSAAVEWYDDWGRMPVHERNMIRWLVVAPNARERLVHWESDARDIVARWRGVFARNSDDARLRDVVAELYEISPEFARWWDDQNVQEHRSRVRLLRHPKYGVRAMRITWLQIPEFPTFGVVLHIPASGTD